MNRHVAGFIVLHIILLAGLYLAWRADLLVPFFMADQIGLTSFVAAVALLGVACVAFRRWDDVALIRRHIVTLGLGGTIVGLSIAIAGLTEGFDIKLLGLHVAFNTSLAGIAGHIWLVINERVLK